MSGPRLTPALALAVCLAAGAALPGCVAGSMPLLPLRAATAEPPTFEVANAQEGYGYVRLAIRWPASYQALQLPISSKRISMQLKDSGNNNVGAPVIVTYPTVSAILGPVAKGNGFKVYVFVQPDVGNNTIIASNTSAVFDVLSGSTTAVSVSVDPAFTPSISSIGNGLAFIGGTLTIIGTDLGNAWLTENPIVLFAGGVSAVATVVNPSKLTVTVPAGAQTGNLSVSTDGVSSNTAACEIGANLSLSSGGQVPASAATFRVTIDADYDGNGTYEAQFVSPDLTSMPGQVAVPKTNIRLSALTAYPASNPPALNGGAIANSGGVVVSTNLTGQTTGAASLNLVSGYSPTIDNLSDPTAAPGTTIVVNGSNFKKPWVSGDPTVFFTGASGWVQATVNTSGDTAVSVVVPNEAISGPVQVRSDGLSSDTVNWTGL